MATSKDLLQLKGNGNDTVCNFQCSRNSSWLHSTINEIDDRELVITTLSPKTSKLITAVKLGGREDMLLVVGQKKKMPESLKTFQVPPSSVLQQARCFLPQLASANAALQEKLMTIPAAQLDIENIDDCHGDIIEMNFAVVENEDSDSCDSGSVSDSDCEDSDEDRPLFLDHLTPGNINIKKPDRHTKRPTIEMMTDSQKSSDTDVSETSTNDIQKVVPEERQHTVNTVTDSERLTDDGLWEQAESVGAF